MNTWHYHADPPRTLAERLRQLNDNLKALGERLKSSIASVIGSTIAEAVKDAVSKLLGAEEAQPLDYRYDRPAPSRWDDRNSNGRYWNDDSGWDDHDEFTAPTPEPTARTETPKRWRNALTMGLQAALWWLKHQPLRRPFLTTVTVTLAAGATAYVAGPTLAAGAGILASVASLLLTADAARSAVKLAAG